MSYRYEKFERKYEQNEWNENENENNPEYNEEFKNSRSKIYQPIDKVSSKNK